jgi:hypothetical protein
MTLNKYSRGDLFIHFTAIVVTDFNYKELSPIELVFRSIKKKIEIFMNDMQNPKINLPWMRTQKIKFKFSS